MAAAEKRRRRRLDDKRRREKMKRRRSEEEGTGDSRLLPFHQESLAEEAEENSNAERKR